LNGPVLFDTSFPAVNLASVFAVESDKTDFVDIVTPVWTWALLGVAIFVLLGIDLWRHREAHAPTFKEAAQESAFWVFCGLSFSVFMLWQFGASAAGEYLGVYITEKSLSIDNVFVWALLFSAMAIPVKYQHRVLFWGIFGALALRTIFITAASGLVSRFSWVLVFFGVFLIYTGIKIIRHRNHDEDEGSTRGLDLLRKVMPVTNELDGQKFFTIENGRRAATPLFAALIVVETTDVIFAVDSVPASFGVANDPFIILAANAFAIMGLRAMYFLLADAKDRFSYLSLALGAILLFVGIKLAITPWYHIPIGASLAVIFGILAIAVMASVTEARKDPLL